MDLSTLVVGDEYERPDLARMWGYDSFHAISRGVVTPRGKNLVILFVTEQNQPALPQYDNSFDGEVLSMDGEEGHRSDERLTASNSNDVVYLFYRGKSHTAFTFFGEMKLASAFLRNDDKPSRFVFSTIHAIQNVDETSQFLEHAGPSGNSQGQSEGSKLLRLHVIYERSRRNRSVALAHHGHVCKVCQFDFDLRYGSDLARQYIEVHHLTPLSQLDGMVVNPQLDLLPLCANCHRMAHRRSELVRVDELIRRVAGAVQQVPR